MKKFIILLLAIAFFATSCTVNSTDSALDLTLPSSVQAGGQLSVTVDLTVGDDAGVLGIGSVWISVEDYIGNYITMSPYMNDTTSDNTEVLTVDLANVEPWDSYITVTGKNTWSDPDINTTPVNINIIGTDGGIISDGDTGLGQIDSDDDDADFYKVVAVAGETIDIDVTYTHADGDIDIRLFDSTGTTVDSSAASSGVENVTYTSTSGGTYYLKVYAFGTANNQSYAIGTSVY